MLTREVLPIPNIGTQINIYLGDHPAGFRNDQLVALWAGGNDLVETRTAADTQRVVDNLEAELMALNANGADDVLVPNQIDQADTPIFNRTPDLQLRWPKSTGCSTLSWTRCWMISMGTRI